MELNHIAIWADSLWKCFFSPKLIYNVISILLKIPEDFNFFNGMRQLDNKIQMEEYVASSKGPVHILVYGEVVYFKNQYRGQICLPPKRTHTGTLRNIKVGLSVLLNIMIYYRTMMLNWCSDVQWNRTGSREKTRAYSEPLWQRWRSHQWEIIDYYWIIDYSVNGHAVWLSIGGKIFYIAYQNVKKTT